jgi:hypothetical protein
LRFLQTTIIYIFQEDWSKNVTKLFSGTQRILNSLCIQVLHCGCDGSGKSFRGRRSQKRKVPQNLVLLFKSGINNSGARNLCALAIKILALPAKMCAFNGRGEELWQKI